MDAWDDGWMGSRWMDERMGPQLLGKLKKLAASANCASPANSGQYGLQLFGLGQLITMHGRRAGFGKG